MNSASHVTVKKFSELSGMSDNAIRALIKKGQWRLNCHFTKSPNGRVFIVVDKAVKWQQGIQA